LALESDLSERGGDDSSGEESSYENNRRKRLRKGEAKTKQRAIMINPDSDNSSESEET